jgi:hypothetical protein
MIMRAIELFLKFRSPLVASNSNIEYGQSGPSSSDFGRRRLKSRRVLNQRVYPSWPASRGVTPIAAADACCRCHSACALW